MKQELIKSGSTMLGSLTGWMISRKNPKVRIPSMLIGGFVGSILGDLATSKKQYKQLAKKSKK